MIFFIAGTDYETKMEGRSGSLALPLKKQVFECLGVSVARASFRINASFAKLIGIISEAHVLGNNDIFYCRY
jgi:hypothetical protein